MARARVSSGPRRDAPHPDPGPDPDPDRPEARCSRPSTRLIGQGLEWQPEDANPTEDANATMCLCRVSILFRRHITPLSAAQQWPRLTGAHRRLTEDPDRRRPRTVSPDRAA
eukprot:scaffold15546_cov33-Phaeocystis_antarctica.AAC.1